MKAFCYYRERGLWWFRIYGYGLHYKNVRLHPPLFSERTGLRKKLKIGKHWFGLLRPNHIESHFRTGQRGEKTEEIRQYYTEGKP